MLSYNVVRVTEWWIMASGSIRWMIIATMTVMRWRWISVHFEFASLLNKLMRGMNKQHTTERKKNQFISINLLIWSFRLFVQSEISIVKLNYFSFWKFFADSLHTNENKTNENKIVKFTVTTTDIAEKCYLIFIFAEFARIIINEEQNPKFK